MTSRVQRPVDYEAQLSVQPHVRAPNWSPDPPPRRSSNLLTPDHPQSTNEAVPVSAPTASKCQMMEERANLMHMMKLSVKVLLQSALSLGRSLDADHAPLQQFFVVMEHCLKHGLKGELEGAFGAGGIRASCWLSMYSSVLSFVLDAGMTAGCKTDGVPARQTRHREQHRPGEMPGKLLLQFLVFLVATLKKKKQKET